jgi:hypothetical protein
MARARKSVKSELLPGVDYYLFYDARDPETSLGVGYQKDRDSWEGEDREPYGERSDETERVSKLRNKRTLEIYPKADPDDYKTFYRDSRHPMPQNMVHKNSWFATRQPLRIEHIESIACFTMVSPDDYTIVSSEWKDAIESVEPMKHEFFPHRLNFLDGALDRFIFRNRIVAPDFLRRKAAGVESPVRRRAVDIFQQLKVVPPGGGSERQG